MSGKDPLKALEAIDHVKRIAYHLKNDDWSGADLDALACDVGIALDNVADALTAILGDVP